jgi:hypothetical protein
VNAALGCVLIYGALFGVGEILLRSLVVGLALVLVAVAAGIVISRNLKPRSKSMLQIKLATTERTEDTEGEPLTGMNLRVLRVLRGGEVISQCTLSRSIRNCRSERSVNRRFMTLRHFHDAEALRFTMLRHLDAIWRAPKKALVAQRTSKYLLTLP